LAQDERLGSAGRLAKPGIGLFELASILQARGDFNSAELQGSVRTHHDGVLIRITFVDNGLDPFAKTMFFPL
jgi:hypothetical protein